MDKNTPTTIDAYIENFPEEIQSILKKLRAEIKNAAPQAVEKISYQMPTYYLEGNLVHFAAFKNHIGFYPAPSGIENFKEQLAGYKTSKGAIQFPLDQPIPYTLIHKIVAFRVLENLARAKAKNK